MNTFSIKRVWYLALLSVFFATPMAGCCSCKDRYAPFLGQLKENLVQDVRPKYERGLKALEKHEGRDPELTKIDLALIDDSASSIQRILDAGEGKESK